MDEAQLFIITVVAFSLYLVLKRYPNLLNDPNETVRDIQKDSIVIAGKPLRKFMQGDVRFMRNSPWLFSPPIGSVITKPNGTETISEQKKPLIIGVP